MLLAESSSTPVFNYKHHFQTEAWQSHAKPSSWVQSPAVGCNPSSRVENVESEYGQNTPRSQANLSTWTSGTNHVQYLQCRFICERIGTVACLSLCWLMASKDIASMSAFQHRYSASILLSFRSAAVFASTMRAVHLAGGVLGCVRQLTMSARSRI